jgi:hypothetical protein
MGATINYPLDDHELSTFGTYYYKRHYYTLAYF